MADLARKWRSSRLVATAAENRLTAQSARRRLRLAGRGICRLHSVSEASGGAPRGTPVPGSISKSSGWQYSASASGPRRFVAIA